MDRNTVDWVARLARLKIDERTGARLAAQLSAILEYFRSLEQFDTATIEPAAHPAGLSGRARPDEEAPSGAAAAVLANVPRRRDDFIQVPRIIE
ncbi:MAG: Asp-tRNA(Asn)/Glu-tRNA(Gln) amidotransferase subunit GatC [Planctomycetes bacterium]|nr:Asp-tRNA(Asn)/Glu-tRNA(Gln) amidotransferase subunit GatC [Planctomycetota bacterium]